MTSQIVYEMHLIIIIYIKCKTSIITLALK